MATPPRSTPDADPLRGLRVLVVEDDYLVATRLRDMLAELGCIVIGPAPTVESGERLAAAERPDLGVLDINIRGGNSGSIAHALRDQGAPVVFVTGYSSPHTLPGDLRAAPRLMKPIEGATLRAALLEQIAHH